MSLFIEISRLTYGKPDHYNETRETICDYIATRYDRFLISFRRSKWLYIQNSRWRYMERRVRNCYIFLLYNATVNIYERFTSQTPDNRYVAGDNAPEINLFYRNGYHYDSFCEKY